MKKYLNPNAEFFACSVMDIITASTDPNVMPSNDIPDILIRY